MDSTSSLGKMGGRSRMIVLLLNFCLISVSIVLMARDAMNSDEFSREPSQGRRNMLWSPIRAVATLASSVCASGEHTEDAVVGFQPEIARHLRLLEIKVDQEDRTFRLTCDAERQIDGQHGLSAAGRRRRHAQDLPRAQVHGLQHLRANHIDRFRPNVADVVSDDAIVLEASCIKPHVLTRQGAFRRRCGALKATIFVCRRRKLFQVRLVVRYVRDLGPRHGFPDFFHRLNRLYA